MKNIRSLKGEKWVQVKEYTNYYVSNYGRVYSGNSNTLLKTYRFKYNKYLYVDLWKKCNRKRIRLNRLVAEYFCPNPDNKPIVHHKDCNSQNNKADNLMWVTQSEHLQIHKELRKAGEN